MVLQNSKTIILFCKSGFAKIKNKNFEIKTHTSEMWVDGITNRAASNPDVLFDSSCLYLKPVIISSPSSRDLRSSRAAQYIALAVFASMIHICMSFRVFCLCFLVLLLFMFVCLPRASREHVWFACPTVPRSEPLLDLNVCLPRAFREHGWFACFYVFVFASRVPRADSMTRQ